MKRPKITVVGSINMDLITSTKKRPKVGETLIGESFMMVPGGKGANQAVAAARLGADVTLLGRVGDDAFGKELREHLQREGVSLCNVEPVTHLSTGVASITLSEGDNSIIVVPGANEEVTPELIDEFEDTIAVSDIVLLQLEIPIKTVEYSIELAHKHGVPVILNPAPIQPLAQSLLEKITYLTPNEHEVDEFALVDVANLIDKLIITKGEKGVSFLHKGTPTHLESFSVEVIDTTGAGDSFNGALAVALSENKDLKEACRFASAVGALAVTKLGAQSGMPTREKVEAFLNKRGLTQ
ncbi:ribokinase [Halalkalibacterium ligniniphilum]|uniref:ribokinase n=1 Tax=Halalkalibacterium ligniniphilum TaxID=1134413 RepID=UPI00034735FA|nr:ribokinase [Halalkalibacterium ligniniphilum]